MQPSTEKRRIRLLTKFFEFEAAGGILLFCAAVIALVAANLPGLAEYYSALLEVPMEIKIGALELHKNFLLVVNDGLMAVFFLLVALEIKREVIDGVLTSFSQIVLPGVAAIGGVICPALIYVYFNYDDPVAVNGWAIPAATDIAFSLAVLSLFGKRVPLGLKVFLTTIAVVDDLVAIIIIALFYTSNFSATALGVAVLCLLVLIILNRSGVTRFGPYALLGIVMWVCVLKSGIHATLAGVALGFTIPFRDRSGSQKPLEHLEHLLHPWVAYGILPLFAFANSGVSFQGVTAETLTAGVAMGIAGGLLVGKVVGVFGGSMMMIAAGLAQPPGGATVMQLLGVSFLTGIGFTMSLFIGSLAFAAQGADFMTVTKMGVFSGSLAAAALGYLVLATSLPKLAHPMANDLPDEADAPR